MTRAAWITGLSLPAVLACVAAGSALGTGGYAVYYGEGLSYLSNDPKACVNCHIMRDHYDGWAEGQPPRRRDLQRLPHPARLHPQVPGRRRRTGSGTPRGSRFRTSTSRSGSARRTAAVLQKNCIHCHHDVVRRTILGPSGRRRGRQLRPLSRRRRPRSDRDRKEPPHVRDPCRLRHAAWLAAYVVIIALVAAAVDRRRCCAADRTSPSASTRRRSTYVRSSSSTRTRSTRPCGARTSRASTTATCARSENDRTAGTAAARRSRKLEDDPRLKRIFAGYAVQRRLPRAARARLHARGPGQDRARARSSSSPGRACTATRRSSRRTARPAAAT